MVSRTFLIIALLFPHLVSAGSSATNSPKCGTTSTDGQVVQLSDGTYKRCMSLITPAKAARPMPVVFWFHGSGGNAAHCGQGNLASIAESSGFALVCGEALQDVLGSGGKWDIPEIITNATGTPCEDSDSYDVPYMKAAVAHLAASPSTYDTSKLFFAGCSMGSAFTEYSATCVKRQEPSSISAFATHSTGWKVKGDGNRFPPTNSGDGYTWGECPKCEYFPFKPESYTDSLGLKACVGDNTGDPSTANPFFYRSSQALAKEWKALGNKAETYFGSGGHCQIHSYETIVNCLDDGTGRLLRSGPVPTPAPSPAPAALLV